MPRRSPRLAEKSVSMTSLEEPVVVESPLEAIPSIEVLSPSQPPPPPQPSIPQETTDELVARMNDITAKLNEVKSSLEELKQKKKKRTYCSVM